MHLFGIVVWLGGLMFQNAVILPFVESGGEPARALMRSVSRRFVGVVWMCVWTIAVTGILMMVLSPKFIWFRFDTTWSMLLAGKQVIFALMVVYAFGYARMVAYLGTPSSNGGFDEKAELYRHRINQFRRMNIALGIAALLLAVGMMAYG
jgi:uncharacterized membrane protein